MIQGKTIVELAQEVDRQMQAARDYVVAGASMAMSDTAELMVGPDAGAFRGEMTVDAHGQVADRMGIPRSYYERMRREQPQLLATNVNTWLMEAPETRHMVRTLDGRARALLSDRYRRLDNLQILAAALPALQNLPVQVLSSEVTERRMYVQARFPAIEGEVRVGDPVQAGFIISNSETGFGALEVRPMVYRLVCTNGLVVAADAEEGRLRRTHIGRQLQAAEDYSIYADDTREADDRALMLKIRDAMTRLSDPALFTRLMDRMRQATEGEQVVRPVAAVEELGKAYALGTEEREAVLTALIRDQDYSRWGMVNAVTHIANRAQSYDRAVELEAMGGKLLHAPQQAWQRIALAA